MGLKFMLKVSRLLYVLAIFLLLAGAFYSIELIKVISLIIFGVTILILFYLPISKKINNFNIDFVSFSFILTFTVMMISSILNKSIELFVGVLLFYLIIINFSIFRLNKPIYDFFDIPVKIVFLIITLLNFSFGVSIPFYGAFSNPNSLGGIYAMISFIATGIILDKSFNSNGRKIDYILLTIIILCSVFTLISNSRISFISSCLCLLSILFYYFYNSFLFKKGFKIKTSFFKKLISVFFVGLFIFIMLWQEIKDIFVKKFIYKLDEGSGITDGRDDVWRSILDNSLIFGHGRYSPHLEYFDLAAHNTFLSIYDQFGWLSCVLFIISITLIFIRFFINKNFKKYGITLFFILLGFVFLSISESMINKTIMFCLLMVVNLNSFEKRNLGKN